MNNDAEVHHFPYQPLSLDKVAILFDLYKDKFIPYLNHSRLPLARPQSRRVAIVVDGIGSSSAGLAVARVVRWVQSAGFSVCAFSYRGISSHFYQPLDTVHTDFDRLVRYLDEYVDYYSQASCVILIGYSFGGLIISEWLYRHRDDISGLSRFKGSCLIASPLRLRATRVYYRRGLQRTQEAQGFVSALLNGYTAIPEHVPVLAPMVIFRCRNDRLLDDSAYTFFDLPLDDRPAEQVVEAAHETIVVAPRLRRPLIGALNVLSESSSDQR